ncbi:hypothetical protein [Parabacteroides timonensis]|uniref:hypothetical protein n=1 Tax=Parabacteroides timonensis TaxID=1871013 RepID=UPI00094F37E3|nr:hypothetical protein [Parabacteroides timonensis]
MKNEDMLKELGKYFIDKRNKMDDRLIIQLFLVACLSIVYFWARHKWGKKDSEGDCNEKK